MSLLYCGTILLRGVAYVLRIVLAALLCVGAHAEVSELSVGVRLVDGRDPVSGGVMKAAVFYPAASGGSQLRLGSLEIDAIRDAAIAPGRHALILLSHGNGGSMFSHHDTAVYLARSGYIVAAIEHPEDNFRDARGQGTDRVIVGRGLQLSSLLDTLLSGELNESIDRNRIGAAGFSAGAYTVLTLTGASPRIELLATFCKRHADSVLCVGGGHVRLSSPPLSSVPDSRVRAAFLMSPVAVFFDRAALQSVKVPVRLFSAERDAVLPPDLHARRIRDELPQVVGYTEIPSAGHFVFLAPCSQSMTHVTPNLCSDPVGVDRIAVHAEIHREMRRFFDSRLSL